MNARVRNLRQDSLDAIPTISGERARLLTDFYQTQRSLESYPIQRARAFQHLLENKAI